MWLPSAGFEINFIFEPTQKLYITSEKLLTSYPYNLGYITFFRAKIIMIYNCDIKIKNGKENKMQTSFNL